MLSTGAAGLPKCNVIMKLGRQIDLLSRLYSVLALVHMSLFLNYILEKQNDALAERFQFATVEKLSFASFPNSR
jgi:hypothetical protein